MSETQNAEMPEPEGEGIPYVPFTEQTSAEMYLCHLVDGKQEMLMYLDSPLPLQIQMPVFSRPIGQLGVSKCSFVTFKLTDKTPTMAEYQAT